MEKIFENGSRNDNRQILITIYNNFIEFFFYDQYRRQNNYINEMEEKFRNGECEELEEDQKTVNGFYWINTDEWVSDRTGRKDREDNWHKHMKTKNWFTHEMYDYIDKNVK